jgi:hypothetical protein
LEGLGDRSKPSSDRANQWIAFRSAYLFTALMRAKKVFEELSLMDAAAAIARSKAYAADLRLRGHTMLVEAWRWVSKRRFDGITETETDAFRGAV